MAVHAANVDRWFKTHHGISCKQEWLEACLYWISQEEGNEVPLSITQDTAYQQWLHADLRECSESRLPPELFTTQSGEINGQHIVQIDSIINVGAPIYSQLQTIQGMETDTDTEHNNKSHNFTIKPLRMLFLTMTDGCSLIKGMEYQLIKQLSVQTPPGTKLLLKGPIKYRLGVMLLVENHVTILGGNVEELVSRNNQKSVLLHKLNIEDSSVRQLQQESEERPPQSEGRPPPSEGRPPPSEGRPPQSEGRPPPSEGRPPPSEGRPPPSEGRPLPSDNNILVDTQSAYCRNNSQGAEFDIDRHGDQRAELYTSFSDSDECGDHGNQGAELYISFSDNDGHGDGRLDFNDSDWNEFCDFDNDTEPNVINTGPSNNSTRPNGNNTGPSNNNTRPSGNNTGPSNNSTRPSGNNTGPSNNSTRVARPSGNNTRPSGNNTGPSNNNTEPSGNNTGPSGNNTGPNDIRVVPVCRVFQAIVGKPLQKVYTKASVSKIEGELAKDTIDWSVGAIITDNTGELPVFIGNGPIEILTGFTLTEYKSRMVPTVQMRQGLLRCHRTLLTINCIMELQWINSNVTITRLLDVN